MTKHELTILVESLLTRVGELEEKLNLIMYGMGSYRPPSYPYYPNPNTNPWKLDDPPIITCYDGRSE